MLPAFHDFIQQHNLLELTQHQLLAVSGGIDSVVMAHLFREAGIPIGLAHVNFQLRGEDSKGDAAFVAKLAQKWDVPFFYTAFDTGAFARERKISIQMAARDLRLEWLENTRKEQEYQRVALGTHQSDQTETILLNLARGTGIRGWQGILPLRDSFVRPLLFATRDQIEAYASKHQLEWREDRSNQSEDYDRNFLRHQVIPQLKKLNPSLDQGLAEHADYVGGVQAVYQQWTEKQRQALLKEEKGSFYLDVAGFQRVGIPGLMYDLLAPFGFAASQMPDLLGLLKAAVGKKVIGPSHVAYRDRGSLIIAKSGDTTLTYEIENDRGALSAPLTMTFSKKQNPGEDSILRSARVASLDADLLQFPLTMRTWRDGDWFQPLGMSGRKKLSDFFIDQKIPGPEKDRTWLLLNGEDIVWVIGHRIDDRYKVTSGTQMVQQIEWLMPG